MHIPGFFCLHEDTSKNVDFFYEIGYNKIYVRKFAAVFLGGPQTTPVNLIRIGWTGSLYENMERNLSVSADDF